MSRQEDFKQASQSLEVQVISNPWTLFEKGCEHGYQYAIDKACEWLREHLGAPAGIPQAKSYNDAINELTTEFRKGMCNG